MKNTKSTFTLHTLAALLMTAHIVPSTLATPTSAAEAEAMQYAFSDDGSRNTAEALFQQAEELNRKPFPNKDDVEKTHELFLQSAQAGYVPAMELLLKGYPPPPPVQRQPSTAQPQQRIVRINGVDLVQRQPGAAQPQQTVVRIDGVDYVPHQPGVAQPQQPQGARPKSPRLAENDPERAKVLALFAQAARFGSAAAVDYFAGLLFAKEVADAQSGDSGVRIDARIDRCAQLASLGSPGACEALVSLYEHGSYERTISVNQRQDGGGYERISTSTTAMKADPSPVLALQWQMLANYLKTSPSSQKVAQLLSQLSAEEVERAREGAEKIIRAHNPPRRNESAAAEFIEQEPDCMKVLYAVAAELPPHELSGA